MRVPDASSESGYWLAYHQYGSNGQRLRPPPTVTDAPLDDNFDAATITKDSEVYQTWNHDDGGSAYDTAEYAKRQSKFMAVQAGSDVRMRRNSESLVINTGKDIVTQQIRSGKTRETDSDRGSIRRTKAGDSHGKTELVEHRVLEDGPIRTISVWREQVANSSEDNAVAHIDLDTPSRRNGHRRTLSGNLSQGSASVVSRESRGGELGRSATGRTSIERNLPRSPLQKTVVGDNPQKLQTYEEKGLSSPITIGSSRRVAANLTLGNLSPTSRSTIRGADSSEISKVDSTSTLELLLSSCRPSLIHLTQTLEDLGIRKEEHLRATAKMNDETRDREVREEALKRGVTVLEWAIFLDKLQGLYSYDDMYTQ